MVDGTFDPDDIFSTLSNHGVRFILIGGIAAILHGDTGVTLDIDIVPAVDPANLGRLAVALQALGARIRADGVPEGLAFDCSGAFLRNLGPDAMLNLTTRAGDLDVAFMPTGTQGFQDLRREAMTINAAGTTVLVASLADVIRSKNAADRDKDRRALPRLRELLERTHAQRKPSG